MSNMSYCEYQNTSSDLDDVWCEWDNFDENDKSEEEIEGRIKIIEIAVAIAQNYGMDEARRLERVLDEKRNPQEEDDE